MLNYIFIPVVVNAIQTYNQGHTIVCKGVPATPS